MNLSRSRKPALALASVFASLALVACGGDDSSDEPSTPPDEVTKEFVTALANGDGEAACSYASAEQVAQIEEQGGCDEVIGAQVGDVTEEELQSVEDSTFEITEETDTTATVVATKPDEGASQEFQLTVEDGEWKISGP